MRVKMITLDAGPAGVRHPGTEHEIDEVEAQDLIDTGHAVAIGGTPKPRDSASDPIERATSGAKENTAGKAAKGGKAK